MKSTGIVRRIDELGRIVIPKEIRGSLGLKNKTAFEPGTSMEIFVDGDKVILKRLDNSCVLCGNVENIHEISNIKVCIECLNRVVEKHGKSTR